PAVSCVLAKSGRAAPPPAASPFWLFSPATSAGATKGEALGGSHRPIPPQPQAEACRDRFGCYAFFGDQPYALAVAPPISIAHSLSLSRSVFRNGSTACS